MSPTRCHGLLCAIAAGWLCVSGALAQAPKDGLLDKKLAENKIAAQKLEADVKDAVEKSRTLAAKNPGQAVELLQKALAQVESDTALSQERRNALADMLKGRIRLYGNDTTKNPPVDPRPGHKLDNEATEAENRLIKRQLDAIAQLKKDGKMAEATRAAEDLARRYPGNAAVMAMKTSLGTGGAVAGNQDIRGDSGSRYVGALASLDKSKLPPIGDVEFPKDWRDKMAKRTSLNKPLLTPKEQSILKALNKPIKVDYDKVSFTDVIEDIATKLDAPIILNRQALNDALITSDTLINLKLNGVTSRTVLRKVLGDFGLAYVIRNETIQVVSQEKARDMMVSRVYYLGDLLSGGPWSDAGIRFNPAIDMLQAQQNVINIIGMIMATVEPDSWEMMGKGGKGTITFAGPQMGIIVKNSAEVHGMMGSYIK